MINKNRIGWFVLNFQLFIGILTTYDYLHRHLIVHNVFAFCILVIFSSNLLFFLLKKIKYFSIRSYISILLSSLIMTLLIVKYNKPYITGYKPIEYLLVIGYFTMIFKLYITMPLAVILEIFLHWKMKRK